MNKTPTRCDACGSITISLRRLNHKTKVYQSRAKWPFVYHCHNCGAECGLRQETSEPLGLMADSHTRYKRREAHLALDKLWQGPTGMPRSLAYKHLAAHMGMNAADCHIGKFNSSQCEEAIQFCLTLHAKLNRKRR